MEDGEKKELRGPLARVLLDPSSTLKPEKQRDHCQDADRLATADAILTTSPPPLLTAKNGRQRRRGEASVAS